MQTYSATLALVHHSRGSGRQHQLRTWDKQFKYSCWTLDYCSFAGLKIRAAVEDGAQIEFDRPKGSWHLYAPGTPYMQYVSRELIFIERMWLQFHLAGPLPLVFQNRLCVALDPDELFAPRVREMYGIEQSRRPGSAAMLQGMLLQILGELERAHSLGQAGTPQDPLLIRRTGDLSPGKTLLDRFDAEISGNIAAPPKMYDLARELKMSVSSLAHRFRTETGMTPVERIRWLRIREARRLLSREGASVKSVAAELGFSSPFYLSRVFKQVTGSTPQDFLAQQRR